MKRYHKNIGFEHIEQLKALNKHIQALNYSFTSHCIAKLKNRFEGNMELKKVLLHIKNVKLQYSNIFEYYIANDKITKMCYRISYNEYNDIIMVLSNKKQVITIYLNNKNDKHKTLKTSLYCKC